VQIHLEFNFGFHFLHGIMEVWAVRTPDKGILAHSVLQRVETPAPRVKPPGIEVFAVTYH
jgi:hypothetical protein